MDWQTSRAIIFIALHKIVYSTDKQIVKRWSKVMHNLPPMLYIKTHKRSYTVSKTTDSNKIKFGTYALPYQPKHVNC